MSYIAVVPTTPAEWAEEWRERMSHSYSEPRDDQLYDGGAIVEEILTEAFAQQQNTVDDNRTAIVIGQLRGAIFALKRPSRDSGRALAMIEEALAYMQGKELP